MRACTHCDRPAAVVAISREGAFDLCPDHDSAARSLAHVLILSPVPREARP